MATTIKAIPTLKGKEARLFQHRAEENEKKFKGFKGIETDPKFIEMREILHKAGMIK